MPRTLTIPLLGLGLLLAAPLPTQAQDQSRTFDVKVMTPETALDIVTAAMEACREKGFQVAVAVVDRSGVPQALVRDRLAGAHTPDTAQRKAWTAVSFKANTLNLAETTQPGSEAFGARQITNALMLGGGIVVNAQGSLLGGIGVSGAPSGADDQSCAQAGLDSVAMDLEF
ncbi:GlcG/HbpS family heme-binding protein [Rhodospirillum sp. A1_3_36]|uniref:GlcG/HbpS family heme-binding protein n=1 Tax=Rhodospirillum sp. A1_3_36 TaxID=3391666 RepID=UPI0039A6C4B8